MKNRPKKLILRLSLLVYLYKLLASLVWVSKESTFPYLGYLPGVGLNKLLDLFKIHVPWNSTSEER